ncbi:piezo-type mechanosensitive ion channel-like protein isoform X1 [Chlorella sorokiniana]|uniref:Piezo-type mechanosensitive ion channel-like protein isoform X1 n=1 Tax=Chlorella sorokiniana TaxID=3076 RepID=A0A2P6TXZ5_CHLSO|nr:piezo-type mechanosensitive ion channel-like protein isoform X1 [Chlorella sorokiniana]|eukprot:PRW58918.1 piezo-type mechanosensitive ion channel-like protein isoform X1 [Chlorella sorokiniana]
MRPAAAHMHPGPATRAASAAHAAAPPSGLLAALTLLLVAWTNVSLGVGLLYLTAFLTWAASCAPAAARHGAGAKRLWAAISGLSALCLLAQLFLQAAFLLGAPGLAAVAPVLRLLGFPAPHGTADVLLAVVPLLLVLMAAAAQVQAARDADSRQQRLAAEGMELQPVGAAAWRRPHGGAMPAASAWAAALALLAAAVAQPSLLAAPYMLAVAAALWRWSGGTAGSSGLSRLPLLKLYTAAAVAGVYLWQAAPTRWPLLLAWARVLGLTSFADPAATWQQLLPAAVQLAAMLVLLPLLSFRLVAGSGSSRPAGLAGSAPWPSSERAPLLQHDQQQQAEQQAQPPAMPASPVRAAGPALTLPQLLYLLLLDTAVVLGRESAVVAAVLCSAALVRPSLLAGVLLLWGLGALLARPIAAGLRSCSRILTAALLVWQLGCYVASITAHVARIPDAAQAVGLQAAATPWPLLVMLAAAAATAALAGSRGSSGGQQQMPPRLQALLARLARLQGGGSSSSTPASPTASHVPGTDAAAAPWLLAWALLLRALWYIGLAAVPAVLFVVGSLCYDVLHGAYLAGLLAVLAVRTLRLKPLFSEAVLRSRRWTWLRCYCSLHLVAAFVAYVGGLPGTDDVLQPANQQQLLTVLGLWRPSVLLSMLPLLGLLLLASLHSAVDAAVHRLAREQAYLSSVGGVQTWHSPGLIYTCRLAVAFGPTLLAALGYLLVLFDCPISLLSLAWLLVLALAFVCQPLPGRWQEVDGGSNILQAAMQGLVQRLGGQRVSLRHSPATRWAPLLLLAAFASADFAAQALLPAAAAADAAGWISLPEGVLDFVQSVVGLSHQAQGMELAVLLLRPLVMLAMLAMLRPAFCLGTLHRQLQEDALPPEVQDARRLHEQLGLRALAKRLVLLHGSKAVALAAFAAAMQQAGAAGMLLIAGVVLLAPALGAPRAGATRRQPLLHTGLTAAAAMAILWILAQTALCVPYIQDLLLHLSPDALDFARWTGFRLPPPPEPGGPSEAASTQLERLLRLKMLLLVAVALRMRAFRWQAKLPEEVRAAGRCGAPCPLFWPCSPGYEPPPLDMPAGSTAWPWLGARTLLGALHEALALLLSKAQHATAQALRAVDWPAGEEERAEQQQQQQQQQFVASGGAVPAGSASASQRQWWLLRFAFQDWTERCWQEWRLDITLFVLLLAAFAAANALSLVAITFVGLGMALGPRAQQRLFKFVVVPTLGMLALGEYAVLLGPPPRLHLLLAMARELKAWLGLVDVDPSTLWLLLLAYGASVLLVHADDWERCAGAQQGWQAQQPVAAGQQQPDVAVGQISRASSFDGIECPSPPPGRSSGPPWALEKAEGGGPARQHATLQVSAAEPLLGPGAGQAAGSASDDSTGAPGLWQPLTLEAQPGWQWHDRLRYWFFRFFLDALLVCVVALSTLEVDALHLCYLALVLWLFRNRIALRYLRNRLFVWLPLLNFAVICATLIYQAPLQLLLPGQRTGKECSVAHVIGLFRLDWDESLLSLGYRGALADCLLWLLIRMQTHIFGSATYDQVQRVVRQEEEREAAEVVAELAASTAKHAAAALEESRQRAAREQRMARLKAASTGAAIDDLYRLPTAPQPAAVQPPPPGAGTSTSELDKSGASSGGAPAGTEPPPAVPATAGEAAAVARAAAVETSARFGSAALAWLRQRLRRTDRESYLCCTLFVAAFLADCSLLALVLPLSLFCYALVSPRPSRLYWRAMLIYTELLVVAQFAAAIPAHLHCPFLTPQLTHSAEVLGIHGADVTRAVPIFLAYLATLFHTFSLPVRLSSDPGSTGLAAADSAGPEAGAEEAPGGDMEAGTAGQQGPLNRRRSSERFLGEQLGSSVSGSLQSLGLRLLQGCYAAYEFLLRSCTVSERAPHFVLVTLPAPSTAAEAAEGGHPGPAWGEQLRVQLQNVLDGLRRSDIAAARERQDQQRASTEEVTEGPPLTFGTSGGPSGTAAPAGPTAQQQSVEVAQPAGSGLAAAATGAAGTVSLGFPDLSTMGPLQLTFVSVQPGSTSGGGGSGAAQDGSKPGSSGSVNVLFEVTPLHSMPANSEGWCSVPGWPLRALNPARAVAATLLRYQQTAASEEQAQDTGEEGAGSLESSELQVLAVEHFSREPQDWYAATTLLDFVAWILVILWYNRVVSSAGSLSDITSKHVIPLQYLATLLIVFALLVLDRVAYTLGSPLLKAALHTGEMVVWLTYALETFWSPLTSASARMLLRYVLALKCGSFALGALQLRSGYPPAAASSGMGRQTFWFMRHVNSTRAIAFQVFLALPFVYELRLLLDWTCTATTLTLMDWFKLEDIAVSLYFVAWNRKLRATKRLGERQPRWLKLVQGLLLFAGLLLLLWVPLLLFSSAAPTFVIPKIQSHGVNATLHAAWGSAAAADFPLYAAGGRRQCQQFLPDDSSLPEELATQGYKAAQFQLLCTGQDADAYWEVTPPAQRALVGALAGQEGGPDVSLSIAWTVERDLPPPSEHGGPMCTGSITIPLDPASQQQLADVLRGTAPSAQLLRANASGDASAALYPLVWLLRGDACVGSPLQLRDVLPTAPGGQAWSGLWAACNASLLPLPSNVAAAVPGLESSSIADNSLAQQRRLAGMADSTSEVAKATSAARWWQLTCGAVNSMGAAVEPQAEEPGLADCGADYGGPRLVAVMERVQGGLIGETLSRLGVAGLYTVVVLSISRFLRLSFSNIRARIPFEDLPHPGPVVSLCQDIAIARASGLLAAEERLFWKLIDLYRAPAAMIALTGQNPPPMRR